jgi:hypothetical protein
MLVVVPLDLCSSCSCVLVFERLVFSLCPKIRSPSSTLLTKKSLKSVPDPSSPVGPSLVRIHQQKRVLWGISAGSENTCDVVMLIATTDGFSFPGKFSWSDLWRVWLVVSRTFRPVESWHQLACDIVAMMCRSMLLHHAMDIKRKASFGPTLC